MSRGRLLATVVLDVAARSAPRAARMVAAAARATDAIVRSPRSRALRRRTERLEAVLAPLGDGFAILLFAFPWALERTAERYGLAGGLSGEGDPGAAGRSRGL